MCTNAVGVTIKFKAKAHTNPKVRIQKRDSGEKVRESDESGLAKLPHVRRQDKLEGYSGIADLDCDLKRYSFKNDPVFEEQDSLFNPRKEVSRLGPVYYTRLN